MATTSTTTNPFLKTLTISLLHKPTSIPTSTSLFFLNKPTKHFSFSTHKPTFFPSPCLAFENDTSLNWDSSSPQVDADVDVNAGDVDVVASETETKPEAELDFADPPEDAKLFVGNLPYDVDSQSLANMFDAAGVVEIAEVIYNRETDRSRGFGFVTMSTVEEADKAVEMFSNYDIGGRLLTVNKAAPRGSRPERPPPREFEPAFRIYVGNLSWDVDSDRLEQLFSEHGKVLSARVVSDRETGRSRGFGFVSMASETEMNDAIAALDGQSFEGRSIRVNVAEERPPRRSY